MVQKMGDDTYFGNGASDKSINGGDSGVSVNGPEVIDGNSAQDHSQDHSQQYDNAVEFFNWLIDEKTSFDEAEYHIERIGENAEQDVHRSCELLNTNADLNSQADSGGDGDEVEKKDPTAKKRNDVAKNLDQLRKRMEDVDPNSKRLTSKVRDQVNRLPFVDDEQVQFKRYAKAQPVLKQIIDRLEEGKDQLQRDNQTLKQEYEAMVSHHNNLREVIDFAINLKDMVDKHVETIDDEYTKNIFLQRMQYPLSQRVQDLQQQQVVAQQAMVLFQSLAGTNDELINGVRRTLSVSVSAVRLGAILNSALERQRKINSITDEVRKTGNEYLKGNASKLKVQGRKIYQDSSQANLNVDDLRKAWSDLETAVNELMTFKKEGIKTIESTIKELDTITSKGSRAIESSGKRGLLTTDESGAQNQKIDLQNREKEKV